MRFTNALLFSLIVAGMSGAIICTLNRMAQLSQRDPFVQEKLAAEMVAAHHSIVFPHGMAESIFRWDLAEQTAVAPDLVILGSSHGQQLSSAFFPNQRVLNLCAAGGMLTDDLVSSEILDARHQRPRHWYVIVDPWLFDTPVDYNLWQRRTRELESIDRRLANSALTPGRPFFLPRIETFRAAQLHFTYQLDPLFQQFDSIARIWTDRAVLADGENYQTPIIRADGSLQIGPERNLSTAEVRILALRQFSEKSDRHRYGNFPDNDPALLHVFESWIHFLSADGEDLTLILAPYHPAIFQQIIAQPKNQLRSIEAYVRKTFQGPKHHLVGSYDPVRAGVIDADFLDGDHLREDGLKKLLRPPAEIVR